MTQTDFEKAVEMVSTSNSIKVAFNVPVKDHCSNVFQLLILESNARIIKQLISTGYSLSMSAKGLVVDKY